MEKVRLYPRVSGSKQAKQGDSLEIQNEKLKEHSRIKGDIIKGTHIDSGKSASIPDERIDIWHKDGFVFSKIDIRKRKGMNEILDLLKDDSWETLKVTKWDRFSRNNIFSRMMQIYFKRNNKHILAIDDSDEPLTRDIKGVLSEEEIRKMKERVRETRLYRFKKGVMPGRSPFGYQPIIKDKKIVGFKPNKKEAEIVKQIFLMASQGIDYKDICSKFHIKPGSYYNILKNKVYYGVISFEGERKIGIHEPIISEELFNKVQIKKPGEF